MTHLQKTNGTRSVWKSMSPCLRDDIETSVSATFKQYGAVNIPSLAEKIRLRHEAENFAVEDVEEEVLHIAMRICAVFSFDRNSPF